MTPITVLLVDDHDIVRAGLLAILKTAEDIQVIGEAFNGLQAVDEAKLLQPQVVLMDLAMPVLNGVEATRLIVKQVPAARVLVLSSYSDVQHVKHALAAGAAGYVMKQCDGNDLLEAILATYAGIPFFSPPIFKSLLREAQKSQREGVDDSSRHAALSIHEAEILQLVGERYANKQIASLILLSIKTVGKHRQSLMHKLNLHNTAALTRYAVNQGIIESGRIPWWDSN